MSDHIHMLVRIPPKIAISNFMGYLKGKSSLMIFERHANLKYKYGNRSFWAKGYFVSTVGMNAEVVKRKKICWKIICRLKNTKIPSRDKPEWEGRREVEALIGERKYRTFDVWIVITLSFIYTINLYFTTYIILKKSIKASQFIK